MDGAGSASRARGLGAGRWQALILGAYLGAMVLAWALSPGPFISDDSCFYLVIARNIVLFGEHTFSGLVPSNGVHPLWLYLLAGYGAVARALTGPQVLSNIGYAVPLAAALVAAGTWNLWRAALRLGLPPLLLAGVPLVYVTLFGVLMSEAHACYLALSLLVRLSVSDALTSKRGPFLLGAVYALLLLARLDTVFIIAAHGVWFLVRTRSLRDAALAGLVAGALVAPYLICNAIYFGGLIPVSGWLKSTFPAVAHSETLIIEGSRTRVRGYTVWSGLAPILLALPVLALSRMPARGPVWALWAGCLGHFLYTALFTEHHTHWYWYYVPNMVLMGLAVSMALAAPRWRTLAAGLGVAALLGAAGLALGAGKRRGSGLGAARQLLVQLCAERAISAQTVLTSDYPGHIAFTTDNRVLGADLLTTNRRFYTELVGAPRPFAYLLDHCRRRGMPVGYVFFTGEGWLSVHADRRGVDLINPKAGASPRVLGSLRFANPPVFEKENVGKGPFILWRTDEADRAE